MRLALTIPQGVESDLQRDVTKVARQAEEAGFAGQAGVPIHLVGVGPGRDQFVSFGS